MPQPYQFPSGGPPNPLGSHFRGGDIGLYPGTIPGGEPQVQINPGSGVNGNVGGDAGYVGYPGNFNAVAPYNNQNYPSPGTGAPDEGGGFRLRYLNPGTAIGGAIRDAFHRHMEHLRMIRNATSSHGGRPPSAPTGLHAQDIPDMYYDYASGTMRPYRDPMSFRDNPNQGEAYGGEFNRVARGREEGNISFPWMLGARLRHLDPLTGDMSVGSTYNPNAEVPLPSAGSGTVPRDTQAWVEQQYRMAYPGG